MTTTRRLYVVCWQGVDAEWRPYSIVDWPGDAHHALHWLCHRISVVDTVCLWFDVTSPHLGLNDTFGRWLCDSESQIVEVTPW